MACVRESSEEKRVVFADAETAGVVQDAVTKARLEDKIEVRFHPYALAGYVVVLDRAYPWELVESCYAGVRVLLRDPPRAF